MAGRLAVMTKVKTTCERKAGSGRNVTDLDFQLTIIAMRGRTCQHAALATFRVSQSALRAVIP